MSRSDRWRNCPFLVALRGVVMNEPASCAVWTGPVVRERATDLRLVLGMSSHGTQLIFSMSKLALASVSTASRLFERTTELRLVQTVRRRLRKVLSVASVHRVTTWQQTVGHFSRRKILPRHHLTFVMRSTCARFLELLLSNVDEVRRDATRSARADPRETAP